jgi:hypothetical protein
MAAVLCAALGGHDRSIKGVTAGSLRQILSHLDVTDPVEESARQRIMASIHRFNLRNWEIKPLKRDFGSQATPKIPPPNSGGSMAAAYFEAKDRGLPQSDADEAAAVAAAAADRSSARTPKKPTASDDFFVRLRWYDNLASMHVAAGRLVDHGVFHWLKVARSLYLGSDFAQEAQFKVLVDFIDRQDDSRETRAMKSLLNGAKGHVDKANAVLAFVWHYLRPLEFNRGKRREGGAEDSPAVPSESGRSFMPGGSDRACPDAKAPADAAGDGKGTILSFLQEMNRSATDLPPRAVDGVPSSAVRSRSFSDADAGDQAEGAVQAMPGSQARLRRRSETDLHPSEPSKFFDS